MNRTSEEKVTFPNRLVLDFKPPPATHAVYLWLRLRFYVTVASLRKVSGAIMLLIPDCWAASPPQILTNFAAVLRENSDIAMVYIMRLASCLHSPAAVASRFWCVHRRDDDRRRLPVHCGSILVVLVYIYCSFSRSIRCSELFMYTNHRRCNLLDIRATRVWRISALMDKPIGEEEEKSCLTALGCLFGA